MQTPERPNPDINSPVMTALQQPQRAAQCQQQTLRSSQQGFTLIEIMLVIVIMGILLAVAYPSYLSALRKGRRAEGISALTAIQQAQERYRANNANYGALAALTGVSANTPNGLYTLAVSNITATTYTVTATAAGSQAHDTACKLIGVQAVGGSLRYGSGSAAIDWDPNDPDAGKCWAK